MANERQGFPDQRDLALQREAERLGNFADDLVEWAGKYAPSRADGDFRISADEEFALYRLRRLASNLWRSANVPVAAAVYGASQVGKSLFMGRVLEPADERDSPLGKDDNFGPPAYFRELSFTHDINPQSGSSEATALVTRFTTKERFDEKALPEYPVKVRALSRAEWLRVLARGFRSECKQPNDITWNEGELRALFEEVSRAHGADAVDRDWRMDLLDVYAYLRQIDPRLYHVAESMFNSFLSQFPLTETGYVELAGRIFWDARNFPGITTHFNDVNRFLVKIRARGADGILLHWAAVRFLLDSQRAPTHENPKSKWKTKVSWSDLRDGFKGDWYVIDYEPGAGGPTEDLAIIQSAMLEMIIPIVPHRLKEDWRDVILRMDILDLPGMRAGGGDSAAGAEKVESTDTKMNIVKRGKVFYLIDRYIEERQIQTLLLLVRGGNLEVRQLLKDYIDKWGKARYGDDRWPRKVVAPQPALFIGLTGIDDEFEKRALNRSLYENRIKQLVDETLYEVMTDFGGHNLPFTNVYPIRYPGSWDADLERRTLSGDPQKWIEAGLAFVESSLVQRHVSSPEEKWRLAMLDNDGGISQICKGFVGCTNSLQKQDALQVQIAEISDDLQAMVRGWYCDPDVNNDRRKRLDSAAKMLRWLEDEQRVYDRIHAVQNALCFDEGEAMEIAEFAESRVGRTRGRTETVEQRFPEFLREQLANWARETAPRRWREQAAADESGSPLIPAEDFGTFVRYLCDYLSSGPVFEELSKRLLSIVKLSIRDAGDRRQAQREYVRVILNDYVLNPGRNEALPKTSGSGGAAFGLMSPFIERWRSRLPDALASVAGTHVDIPAGNDELQDLRNRN